MRRGLLLFTDSISIPSPESLPAATAAVSHARYPMPGWVDPEREAAARSGGRPYRQVAGRPNWPACARTRYPGCVGHVSESRLVHDPAELQFQRLVLLTAASFEYDMGQAPPLPASLQFHEHPLEPEFHRYMVRITVGVSRRAEFRLANRAGDNDERAPLDQGVQIAIKVFVSP